MTEADPRARSDWAASRAGMVVGWVLPILVMALEDEVLPGYRGILWPLALAWMGVACLINARRCGRTHCFFTGPFFLALAVAAAVYGWLGAPDGGDGWRWIGGVTIVGWIVLHFGSERLWGRYRGGALSR